MRRLLLLVALALTMTWTGCDNSHRSADADFRPTFHAVGQQHNQTLSEVLRLMQQGAGKTASGYTVESVRTLAYETATFKGFGEVAVEESEQKLAVLREAVRERLGQGKSSEDPELNVGTLHQAGFLSDRQKGYIDRIKAVADGPSILAHADTASMSAPVRNLISEAYSVLGDSAQVVAIYGETFLHSAAYWMENKEEWLALSAPLGKQMEGINWAEVWGADAGGAVTGAIAGVYAGAKGAIGAFIFWGPAGAAAWLLRAGLTGAVLAGASASLAEYVQQATVEALSD